MIGNYKHMTCEELRKYRYLSNSNGRPNSRLTNEIWQKEFEIRKMFVTPYKNGRTKKLAGLQYQESGNWNEERDGKYQTFSNSTMTIYGQNTGMDTGKYDWYEILSGLPSFQATLNPYKQHIKPQFHRSKLYFIYKGA